MKRALLVVVACIASMGAGPLADFKFQGMPLGTALSDFQKEYPNAVLRDTTNNAVHLKSYIVVPSQFADALLFEFVDDKLYSVGMLYYPARINDLGGLDNLAKRLIHTFGPPTKISSTEVVWVDAESKRTASVATAEGNAMLTVVDTEVETILNERRSKSANLGF